jgi:hypothetical protein
VTGKVKSRVYENQMPKALPSGSYYSAIKKIAEEKMHGSMWVAGGISAESYAEMLVTNVLKANPTTPFWKGGSAMILWVISTFLWHNVWVRFFRDLR